MSKTKEVHKGISIKADSQETLDYLADKITLALTEAITEQCPDLRDEECEKAVRKSVLEVFDKFGEVPL